MRKLLKLVALVSVAAGTFGTVMPAAAQIIALDSTRGTGNQDWTGPLGMDFDVLSSSIIIQQLGAFDSGQDGFTSGVTVGIFDRNTQALVAGLLPTVITTASTLIGQSRYNDIPDFVLPTGNYSIVAGGLLTGFSSVDLNGNAGFFGPTPTINTGGGAISFVGLARYGSSTTLFSYPTIVDTGPANRYDAGTFIFAIPEPETYALLLAGLALIGFVARRRSALRFA